MRFMERDQQTCDALLPGLREKLAEIPLSELESENSPAIELFRHHGGPNLLVPNGYGGIGADALDAVRVQRALGALAPSMTVATMMHHFSIGTLYAVADAVGADSGLDDLLLKRVASDRMLVASGFAEGRTNQGILAPQVEAVPAEGGYLITGSKKPCSLANSMDLLTASVGIRDDDGNIGMGFLMLPADTPGVSIHPFWSSFALAGAQSHEVRLTDVFVTEEQVIKPDPALADELDQLQTVGLIWFEMAVCAAYTGIASALVSRVLDRGRGSVTERAALAVRIETAAALTEGLARRVMDEEVDNDGLAQSLVTRFAVQDAVCQTVNQAVEMLGGMAYVSSPDVAYLAAASHAIAFHPPSRGSIAAGLVDYYAGNPIVVA
jgi:alkylation response protein AidB-like acyl-CoA dehydrogenase